VFPVVVSSTWITHYRIVISAMKRKTILSAVAVEAPCVCPFFVSSFFLGIQLILSIIDVVSFMWLSTAAYAGYIGEGNPAFMPFLDRTFQPDSCGYSRDRN